MNRRLRFVLIGLGIVLAVLLLDLVIIQQHAAQQQEQFAQRAEAQVRLLATLVIPYVNRDDQAGLTTLLDNAVNVDLLYAQVAMNGQVLAQSVAPEVEPLALPVEPLKLTVEDRRGVIRKLLNNDSSLDLRLGLTPLVIQSDKRMIGADPATTYLRVGYSLDSVNLEVDRTTRFILVVSGLLLVTFGLIVWLTVHVTRTRQPHKPTAAPVEPESTTPSMAIDPRVAGHTAGNGPVTAGWNGRVLRLRGGEVRVDEERKWIAFDGHQIALSPKEYKLFTQLASEPTRTFTDQEIIQAVWGSESFATSKDVKQYIYFLRRKLGDDAEAPKFIETVRGHGYRLAV